MFLKLFLPRGISKLARGEALGMVSPEVDLFRQPLPSCRFPPAEPPLLYSSEANNENFVKLSQI